MTRKLALASLISSLMVALSIFAALTGRNAVAHFLRGGMPDDALIVSSASIALGPIALGGATLGLELKDELIDDERVQSVEVEEALTVPARISGSFFGHGYGTDVAVIGLAPDISWFVENLPNEKWNNTSPLPVIVPRIFLDAYNSSFAPAHGLPLLSKDAFIGRTFTFEAGISSLGTASRGSRALPATIVGFTDRTDIMGVVVPLDFVRETNAALGEGIVARRLIVFVKSPSEAETLAADLRAKGYAVSAPFERLRNLRMIDIAVFSLLATAILFITALAGISSLFAATSYLLERKDEAELCHQLGFSRKATVQRFVTAIIRPSVVGSIIGAVAAAGLAETVILMISRNSFLIASDTNIAVISAVGGFLVPSLGMAIGSVIGATQVIPEWKRRRAL